MFKVVTDHLKVSQGWVRCGHCAEVFDASLHLQAASSPTPLARELPDTAPTQAAEFSGSPAAGVDGDSSSPSAAPTDSHHDQVSSPGASFADRSYSPPPSAVGSFISGDDGEQADFDRADWKQQLHANQLDESGRLRLNDQGEAVRAQPFLASNVLSTSKEVSADVIDSVSPEPASEMPGDASGDVSFVRDARRKAFWRKPVVRFVLSILSLLLAALLLMQFVFQQKDSLAAFEPRFTPWFHAACDYLQCEIGPLRQIEAIMIDSSSFNKLGSDTYRLGFSLKNTSSTSVAMPSLEVTLTDSQDQPLLRRVLTPAQFGAASEMLGARSDFSGLVALQAIASDATGPAVPLRVAGYRVLAFYP